MPTPAKEAGAAAVRARLLALRDPAYQAFQQKLMPTVPPGRVLGVRTPALRALARELAGTAEAGAFLRALPHDFYEEDNLHGFLLERIRTYPEALAALEAFLPYIDNWATCDCTSPKVFGRHKAELLGPVRRWLASGHTYTVRYGIGTLMRWYLDADFRPEHLGWVAGVHSGEYYINMMRAWYFATALAKQPAAAWPWLEPGRLDEWTHRKAVQKALESRRIPEADKQRLRALRACS